MKYKTNEKLKKIVFILITILVCLMLISNISFADVGSFESYSSGSSGGSSHSSSSSSYSSGSSHSGHSSYSGNSSYSGGSGLGLFIFIIIFIIIYSVIKKNNNLTGTQYQPQPTHKSEQQIISEIQEHDELFNKDEIIAWSKDLFVRLQQSWSKRDWSEIRVFETNALFEQHKNQLQGYIDNNTINVMDRICVNYANLYDYRISGDKELLVIKLNSRMQDYIIDATTKKVIKGDPNIERTNSYLLTFERKLGVKTKAGTIVVNTTNCPNCGAPTQITSAGKCEYCGSVITTGEYNWCLSNLERAQY
ncbi:MAG: TIM44-like domain-containing protein [Clostridia bacterium]|nr:TIM44-like domain-containing protein [Clostridia bacterium]